MSDETLFDITKHYASLLAAHFKWTRCYTARGGAYVIARGFGQTESKRLSGETVREAGRRLEAFIDENVYSVWH